MAGIYIHIPFCKTRCVYCDFYSTTRSADKDQYIRAACAELQMRQSYLDGEPVRTIYFGGGTPSQLDPDDFRAIFECIDRLYGMEQCEEITLEANPDDLTPDYLRQLAELPFNRISIGIQTFNEQTLKLLKRRHTASQAVQAVKDAREAGFRNISIDLIYGLPGETTESWENDLDQAIALQVEHISAYHLTYEENTPLYAMLKAREVAEVAEENSLSFFTLLTRKLAEAGYEQYEISNFCLPGKISGHNSAYWKGARYIGIGPSAHSYNKVSREWNVASLRKYIAGITAGKRDYEIETLDDDTRFNDLIVTAMRTTWGVSLRLVGEEFGKKYLDHILRNAQSYLQNHELEIDNQHLRLTPKGIFISDSIMTDLLWV